MITIVIDYIQTNLGEFSKVTIRMDDKRISSERGIEFGSGGYLLYSDNLNNPKIDWLRKCTSFEAYDCEIIKEYDFDDDTAILIADIELYGIDSY